MKYKAGIYGGKECVYVEERELEPCGPNDIIVKNLYCGVCGADIDIYKDGPEGHAYKVGGFFGHEQLSEIIEVGENVKDLEIGQHVYCFGSYARPRDIGGTAGFSSHMWIPNAKKDWNVIVIPEGVNDEKAALIEPFQIGTKAARLGEPKGKGVVVYGAGMIGMTAAFAAREMGATKVMVCDLSDYRLNNAKNCGFETCNPSTEDIREKGKAVFGPNTFARKDSFEAAVWIDATGKAPVPATFQDVAMFGATLVVVGVHVQPREIDLKRITYSQHRLQGSAGYEHQDFPIIFQILEKYDKELNNLISHRFTQDQLADAIKQATKASETLKVMVKFE